MYTTFILEQRQMIYQISIGWKNIIQKLIKLFHELIDLNFISTTNTGIIIIIIIISDDLQVVRKVNDKFLIQLEPKPFARHSLIIQQVTSNTHHFNCSGWVTLLGRVWSFWLYQSLRTTKEALGKLCAAILWRGMRNLITKWRVRFLNVKIYKTFDLKFLNPRMSLKLHENTGAV